MNIDKITLYRKIEKTLHKVPNSNHISEIVCKNFCHILLVDAKYIHVKGYDKGTAFIYCIDYYSHDILINLLAPSESYAAYLSFFSKVKAMNYPLEFLVCDGLEHIIEACRYYYPNTKIQLCLNHIKEGIRRILKVRSDGTHKAFFTRLAFAFELKHHLRDYYSYIRKLIREYSINPIHISIFSEIVKKDKYLIIHIIFPHVPATNNLIEAFNSHLEARLKSIRGFQSRESAEIWLNAYVMNRRLSKFTNCTDKFKYLNGTISLAHTAMYDAPKIFLLKKVNVKD